VTGSTAPGQLLGYSRVSTGHQSLDAQIDALTAAGVDRARVYSDKLTGTSTKEQRPGLAAVLDYAREGDTIVVIGIDRLGRNAAEVMLTIRDLGERGIVLRSLREGIDTSNAAGRMIAGVLASLAELELELGRERRTASRAARKARDLPIGRPKALTADQIALAERMRANGEPVPVIAETLGVSRATLYRTLADKDGEPMPRQSWSEDHVIAADDFYRANGLLDAAHAEVQALADRLGRVPTAVAMKLLDLHKAHAEPGAYPGKHWRFSKLDRKVADR
jgi:DNA invertase Pin-like site-specific DNA recombinase